MPITPYNTDLKMKKDKYREYHRNKWRERRDNKIQELGGCCCYCSSTDNLQFDHKDPSKKKFQFTKILNNKSTYEIDTEWKNCQLLCEKCHLKKTITEKKPFKHGTVYSILRKKCQCKKCLKFKREYYDKRNKSRNLNRKSQHNLPAECGTRKKYWRGCRCDLCRKANADSEKVRRQKKNR